MPPALVENMTVKPKKIVFNDDGEIVTATEQATEIGRKDGKKNKTKSTTQTAEDAVKKEDPDDYGEDDYFAKRNKLRMQQKEAESGDEAQKAWYSVFPQYPITDEVVDMKENDQMELFNLCKSSFQAEMTSTFSKRNPSDSHWLQTALQKGTAKDRANAGALLVTSNALGNLEALETLIGFTKPSNKSCTEVIAILTDLWREVLLPPQRKLLSVQMRGADWKVVRKDPALPKERQRRIYAYWHYENELKDHYFEFLKNLQMCMQTGQENAKSVGIVASAQLLAFAPEKEQMLLNMLINKLGDPIPKIASKALHHLSNVARKHPNMCGVIVTEAERLLFRNNVAERAQHFTLCFLASIAPAGRPEVCTKLVNICFGLFKVLVQRGAINNRTMQAILRCLQKAIVEARPADGSNELLSKEMQDTVYRLVHLADIRIAVQTLGLLLQLVTVQQSATADRFYNALYSKLLDMELLNIGSKTAAQLLHIIHRAVHIDSQVARARAFVKRLLQLALYMPAHMAAGCLIVLHKLLRSRKELLDSLAVPVGMSEATATDEQLAKFDSDGEGEEKYEDVRSSDDEAVAPGAAERESAIASSWHHSKVAAFGGGSGGNDGDDGDGDGNVAAKKVRNMSASKYDPYHRAPAYAGAELTLRHELLLLRAHYHPTVQLFADSILNQKRIDYYGDPLRDFGLPHFLERFAFKNPKKLDNSQAEKPAATAHRSYVAYGGRGRPVGSLTASNCTEDEMFIFNYLEQKRQRSVVKTPKATDDAEDIEQSADVDDDEFEAYLDGFFGKKNTQEAAGDVDDDDDEQDLDFLKDLGGELKTDSKNSKQQKAKKKAASRLDAEEDEDDDAAADWGDDADDDEASDFGGDAASDDDELGSIDGDDDDDDDDVDDDDDEDADDDESNLEDDSDEGELSPPKSKKSRSNGVDGRNFAKQLKHNTDMNSLFAAADDFAELLEETGKTKGQGTTNAIYNKDKSSDKQMKWEEKRRSNAKTYTKRAAGAAGGGKRKR